MTVKTPIGKITASRETLEKLFMIIMEVTVLDGITSVKADEITDAIYKKLISE